MDIAHLATRLISRVSGGEEQRALIARGLIQKTPNMLLDEPTNHLDIRLQHEVLSLLSGLDCTVVVVLHDLKLAASYCDSLLLLDQGRAAAHGTPEEVLRPDHLEPVYRVPVTVLNLPNGRIHLLLAEQFDQNSLISIHKYEDANEQHRTCP